MIGVVEETNAGLRLRLNDASFTANSMNQASFADGSSDFLLRSEDAMSRFTALQLVVLQCSPSLASSSSAERFESDRKDAALARLFAAELFAQGAPMVIVIPSLGPEMSVAVLEMLARAISKRHRGNRTLQDAIVDVRAIVAKADESKKGEPATRETALDICFYCTPDWDGRMIT